MATATADGIEVVVDSTLPPAPGFVRETGAAAKKKVGRVETSEAVVAPPGGKEAGARVFVPGMTEEAKEKAKGGTKGAKETGPLAEEAGPAALPNRGDAVALSCAEKEKVNVKKGRPPSLAEEAGPAAPPNRGEGIASSRVEKEKGGPPSHPGGGRRLLPPSDEFSEEPDLPVGLEREVLRRGKGAGDDPNHHRQERSADNLPPGGQDVTAEVENERERDEEETPSAGIADPQAAPLASGVQAGMSEPPLEFLVPTAQVVDIPDDVSIHTALRVTAIADVSDAVKEQRVRMGLCPGCGTQLFRQKRTGWGGGGREVLVPVTEPGVSDRGRCLRCQPIVEEGGDLSGTGHSVDQQPDDAGSGSTVSFFKRHRRKILAFVAVVVITLAVVAGVLATGGQPEPGTTDSTLITPQTSPIPTSIPPTPQPTSSDTNPTTSTPSLSRSSEFAETGDEICAVGYVMDNYCLDRGTLLENPALVTLDSPDQHTVHCLLDVPGCRESGYEVLIDPPEGQTTHCRGYLLDEFGNEEAIALMEETAVCASCRQSGSQSTMGFRITVKGTVKDASEHDLAPRIAVKEVLPSSVGCATGTLKLPASAARCAPWAVTEPEPSPTDSTSLPTLGPLVQTRSYIQNVTLSFTRMLFDGEFTIFETVMESYTADYSRGVLVTANCEVMSQTVHMSGDVTLVYRMEWTSDRTNEAASTEELAELGDLFMAHVNSDLNRTLQDLIEGGLDITRVDWVVDPLAPMAVPTPSPTTILPSFVTIDNRLSFEYIVMDPDPGVGDGTRGTFRATITFEGTGWIGVGIPDPNGPGGMVGAHAIIGLPDMDIDQQVLKYNLVAQAPQHIIRQEKQTLMNTSIQQIDGKTVMSFTKYLLEENEHPIASKGTQAFIYAAGNSNTLGYHGFRGRTELPM